MGYGVIIFSIIGISSSFLLCLKNLKKWQKQQNAGNKLKLIKETLEQAEAMAVKYQERHDYILSEICSHYLTHQDLEDALAAARIAMNQALEFVARLREMQIKILINFPHEADLSVLDM